MQLESSLFQTRKQLQELEKKFNAVEVPQGSLTTSEKLGPGKCTKNENTAWTPTLLGSSSNPISGSNILPANTQSMDGIWRWF